MTDAPAPALLALTADAATVISRLPGFGRLMILSSRAGVTHERIGVLETVSIEGDTAVCRGADHDSRIHLPAIARMLVDRSPVMNGKSYPRIDFLDATGETLFGAVGFDGLEPFDTALEGLGVEPAGEKAPAGAFDRSAEVDPADPALAALEAALAAGQPVTIAVAEPGFDQRWQGVVAKIVPSMGFINVMTPNFHFHLRSGAVGGWNRDETAEGVTLSAHAPDGARIGLSLHAADRAAFGEGGDRPALA